MCLHPVFPSRRYPGFTVLSTYPLLYFISHKNIHFLVHTITDCKYAETACTCKMNEHRHAAYICVKVCMHVCCMLCVFETECFLSLFFGNANRGIYFSFKQWPMIFKCCFNFSSKKTCNIQNVSDDEKCASLILVSVSNQKKLLRDSFKKNVRHLLA